MKLKKQLTATCTALTFVIVGCNQKNHVAHDHDGDGIADHGPGEHGKAVAHDHDGDGKPDHGPGEHEAHEADHGHAHAEKIAGPNGGKIITSVEPHAEFFVTADNQVLITFLDESNQAITITSQKVTAVCGDRSNPTLLSFAKHAYGMSLLSNETLPAGNKYPIIITFNMTADADPVRAKFTVNLSDCPDCDYKEYACTCDHAHNDDHGHDH